MPPTRNLGSRHITTMVIGIDAHKRTHATVVVDRTGRQLSTKTIGNTSEGHLSLLRWATEQCGDRRWAIEDCRHLSRRASNAIDRRRRTDNSGPAQVDGERPRQRPHQRQVGSDRRARSRTRGPA
ncbi:transposase [Rhodococcus sp. A14]|uniref:IS110 family transposase n=1 Tax=Rhodococcus sp. A14 TaxID=1194106 RepID=UPI0032170B9F